MPKAKSEAKEEKPSKSGGMQFETVETKPGDHGKNANLYAALAYFFNWLGGLVILFAVEKEDKWVRFCAAQALILGIAEIVIAMVLSVVLIGFILFPIFFLFNLYLAYLAYTWKTMRIPYIAEYADKLAEPK